VPLCACVASTVTVPPLSLLVHGAPGAVPVVYFSKSSQISAVVQPSVLAPALPACALEPALSAAPAPPIPALVPPSAFEPV
jgi:hypothetical protein